MYNLAQLKENREIWRGLDSIPVHCDWCNNKFDIKYGTLYNIIYRDAPGVYCSRKCSGSHRAYITQEKFKRQGGKECKRCGEFKKMDEFSSLPNPPYYRAECKRCHNYKPARKYSIYRDKAKRRNMPFELTVDQFSGYQNSNCFYCDDSIKYISIDIIEPEVGYTITNTISCCKTCTKFKGEFNHYEFLELCENIIKNVKGEF